MNATTAVNAAASSTTTAPAAAAIHSSGRRVRGLAAALTAAVRTGPGISQFPTLAGITEAARQRPPAWRTVTSTGPASVGTDRLTLPAVAAVTAAGPVTRVAGM